MDNRIIMSQKECKQYPSIQAVLNKTMTQKLAAATIGLSVRHLRRKAQRLKEFGPEGLLHRSRGRPSRRALNRDFVEKIVTIVKTRYYDFGPTFAAEKLLENFNIKISHETLRKIMIKEGIWQPAIRRPKHRKRRPRRTNLGMLVQLDGSYHDWFEGRREKCTLLVFIDDATSQILNLCFAESESFLALAKATLNYMQNQGAPVAIYVDHGSVFHVNTNNPGHTKLTQYEKILNSLNVGLIKAKSPQAKGRVERCNQVMQDRLVKDLRLNQISDIDSANKFLQEKFLPRYRTKFAVEASCPEDFHRIIPQIQDYFYAVEKRRITNDFIINYKSRTFQLKSSENPALRPKMKVEVRHYLDNQIRFFSKEHELDFFEVFSAKPIKSLCRAALPTKLLQLSDNLAINAPCR